MLFIHKFWRQLWVNCRCWSVNHFAKCQVTIHLIWIVIFWVWSSSYGPYWGCERLRTRRNILFGHLQNLQQWTSWGLPEFLPWDQIYDQCISLISLADDYDVSLTSNSLVNINNLLYLTEIFGTKTDVEFVPEKTKLVNFALSFSIDDAEEQK